MTKRDPTTDPSVSRRMAATRGRDNLCEKTLRSLLHRMGLRYRTHCSLMPGTKRSVDITFSGARVAVFVDGCFWHGCPKHGTWPKRRADWWRQKIESNRRRDLDTNSRLALLGWKVVRIWEHDDPHTAAEMIKRLVLRRRSRGT